MKATFGIAAAVIGAAALAVSGPAKAAFPEKDITFIIPYGPGGGFDTYVRKMAPLMEKQLPDGINVVPKNVPGAGGRQAIASLYRATPDGYTIAIFNMPGMALDQILGKETRYDIQKFTWLGQFAVSPYVLAVAKDGPFNSVEDLKKESRQLKYAVTSLSSTSSVSGHVLVDALGLDVKFLPGYKGSSKISIAIIQGNTDLSLFAVRSYTKYAESGDLQAVLSLEQKSPFEGVPTAADIGKPELADLGVHRLVGAPPETPDDVADVLEETLLKAMKDPSLNDWVRPVAPLGAEATDEKVDRLIGFYTKYKSALE